MRHTFRATAQRIDSGTPTGHWGQCAALLLLVQSTKVQGCASMGNGEANVLVRQQDCWRFWSCAYSTCSVQTLNVCHPRLTGVGEG
jgi:hypothetical protein